MGTERTSILSSPLIPTHASEDAAPRRTPYSPKQVFSLSIYQEHFFLALHMTLCSMTDERILDRTTSSISCESSRSSISCGSSSNGAVTTSMSISSSSNSYSNNSNNSSASSQPRAVAPAAVVCAVARDSVNVPHATESKAVDHEDEAKSNAADMVADLQSDTTVNSSERSSQSDSSVSSELDEFDDEYYEEEQDQCLDNDNHTRFLLKPMSPLLQVCPVDDLAVEEEKRRRRLLRKSGASGKGKNKKRTCADAESLPSAPSPLILTHPKHGRNSHAQGSPAQTASRAIANGPMLPAPQLFRRDSMAIRQQYWKQLGFNLSRSDLERTTGRKKERREGLKVRLNDAPTRKGESKNFFQFIASWYGSNSPPNATDATATAAADGKSASSATTETNAPTRGSSSSSQACRRKSIHFNEEAELFYIPLHKDYSKRQRDCMWHTRVEFISMVERNLEDVYEEMEREYEEQLEAECLENEAMALEEAWQRKQEAEHKAIEASKVAAAAAKKQAVAAAIRARSPSLSPSTRGQPLSGNGAALNPIPTLSLCPLETQIKIAPRGRSTHDIRFKYLKHLGIKNS